MKNTSLDLNNHLFAQLERLSDEDMRGNDLKEEIERARAISQVSKGVIENSKLALEAQKLIDNRENDNTKLPGYFKGDEK